MYKSLYGIVAQWHRQDNSHLRTI